MNMQERAKTRRGGHRAESGNRNIQLRRAAAIFIIAAIAVVTTTVVMVGGSEPAHACLLPGIPC